MAFAGNELNIECELKMPANESSDILTCSDPFHHQIYNCDIPATAGQPEVFKRRLELKKLKSSGEYSCRYKTAEVYWFLRVRGEHKRRESEWKMELPEPGFSYFSSVLSYLQIGGDDKVWAVCWRLYLMFIQITLMMILSYQKPQKKKSVVNSEDLLDVAQWVNKGGSTVILLT